MDELLVKCDKINYIYNYFIVLNILKHNNNKIIFQGVSILDCFTKTSAMFKFKFRT